MNPSGSIFDFRVEGIRFQVLGFEFRVSGLRFQFSGFEVRVSGLRVQFSGFEVRVSGGGTQGYAGPLHFKHFTRTPHPKP